MLKEIGKKIQALLCFFGLHKWVYENGRSYVDYYIENLWLNPKMVDLDNKEPQRKCECCQKEQILEMHCLGMNPPEFVYYWTTFVSVRHVVRGAK